MPSSSSDRESFKPAIGPFDHRWTYFQRPVIQEWQISVHAHMYMRENRALCVGRAGNVVGGSWDICFCTKMVTDLNQFYRGGNVLLPLYSYSEDEGLFDGRVPNFSSGFIAALAARLGLPVDQTGLPQGVSPEDIFHYAYAVFHSPGYRSRYAEFLKVDFPRLPLTGNQELFRALSQVGAELTSLHLLEATNLSQQAPEFISGRSREVEKVSWSGDAVWIDRARTTCFKGVPEQVWSFQIGGYQVCNKWLKDRKGRTLSNEDIAHYSKTVVALRETIRLMSMVDTIVGQHGGWPGAFQTGDEKSQSGRVIPFRKRTFKPRPEERYVTCVPLIAIKAAAGWFGDPQDLDGGQPSWTAVEARHRLRPGMFVAQVVGKSMEPLIPDGSYCLFRAPVEGTRQGKTVLVELRDTTDPETGQRYTVKRFASEKSESDDGWQHEKIALKPLNPDFEPILLSGMDQGELRVIAELVEVLGSEA